MSEAFEKKKAQEAFVLEAFAEVVRLLAREAVLNGAADNDGPGLRQVDFTQGPDRITGA